MMKRLTLMLAAFALVACGDDDDSGTTAAPTPRGAANAPALGTQIDRAARSAVSTALVDTFNSDAAAKGVTKDNYNAAGVSTWSTYEGAIAGALAILDSLDMNCGNQLAADAASPRYSLLAGVLADDQIYVNSDSGTCGTYLGLEAEVVGAVAAGAGGCGGRMPGDDTVDRTYSVLAAGALSGVGDGVDANDVAAVTTFPYLANPH